MTGDVYATNDDVRRGPGSGSDFGNAVPRADDGAGEFDLARYMRLAIKHRILIAGTTLAAIVIGLTITLLMTPIFTAASTIQIDREGARVLDKDTDVLASETQIQGEEFYNTQYGLLRSRSLAERVIDTMGLANSDAFLETMEVTPPDPEEGTAAERIAARRELVLGVVMANLGISPVAGSRLVMIEFNSPDPALSARVANSFAENFIQASLDRRFESTSYVRDFLEERIAQTKSKLEETERQLVDYASQQQIINLRDQSDSSNQESLASRNLGTLNGSLAAAQAARIAAEERWRTASSTPLLSLPAVLENGAVQRLSEEKARLESEYQQKLSIYQPDYPEMRQLRARITELDRGILEIAGTIRNSIRSEYQTAANEERALLAQVNGLKGDVLDLRDRSIQYNILQREIDTSRTLYDGLLQRYKEVGAAGGVTVNNVSIIDRAEPPTAPSSPNMLLNLVIATLLGGALGVLGALLFEALDETLATPEDIEQKLGLPVLGVVPLLERDEKPAAALADVRSGFSEAYYSLRTALQFSTRNGAPASLVVTSSKPGEGKSTSAFAVALNLARVGKRVLLADGDLRNPSLHRVLGLDNSQGFSNLLAGSGDLQSLAIDSGYKSLAFLPCGPLPPNPAELWGSDRLTSLIAEATAHYDHIVIDGPPVLGFADAPLLAAAVEGTLFVVESRSTRRAQARGAIRRLSIGSGRILGVVFTKFNAKAASYGGYDYAYDYNYGMEERRRKAEEA
ncbi:polysaccharide biosynthesis tyrosine autokinase [Rhizobium sp. CRIBSB]|nr:polysaccharide biosynthesis tyrosine autokinase [Rhizobium sp. CRIBSB]